MNHKQELALSFIGGALVATTGLGLANRKQTMDTLKIAYNQLTFDNITSFCGTLWVGNMAYQYSVSLFI